MSKPTIRILRPGDEAALEAFLQPRLASSMFLIGNMRAAGLEDNGRQYEGRYAAAFGDGDIIGVVAHYWNQNLICQAPAVHRDALWRAAAEASGRPIRGLIGPAEQVSAVKEALVIEEKIIQLDEAEKLYHLKLVELIQPELLRLGQVRGRRIEPGDLELVTNWRIAYSLETLGAHDTPELRESCRASMERSLKDRTTWILEVDGEPVACTSFNAVIDEAVQVGGVWTPPPLRRRGYGRAVVAASLLEARTEGVEQAILFTGQDNIPAQKAYIALGFRHIDYYRLILLHTPIRPSS